MKMTEFKFFAAYLALLVIAATLGACEDAGTVTSKANRNDITVSVKWLRPDEVDAACKAAGTKDGEHFNACAASGAKVCTIYAVQPRNFNDTAALKTLGHEAWHCFGARH